MIQTPLLAEQLSIQQLDQVEVLCTDFEAEWKAGRQPRIEMVLAQSPPELAQVLLQELLGVEIWHRRRSGQCPRPDDYLERFPTLSKEACDSVFRSMPTLPAVRGTAHPQALRIQGFEIVRQIGAGGMGTVYEARQASLNRTVALKVLSGTLGLSSRGVLRFRQEAESAARLHHTNIVPIYEIGESNGIHYYTMELVQGPSLATVLEQLSRTPRSRSTDIEPETAGHDIGIQEKLPNWLRDTLPIPTNSRETKASAPDSGSFPGSESNYFITVARMTADVADALEHAHRRHVIHRDVKPSNLLLSPDGRLVLSDFGLARIVDKPGLTMSGEILGSPCYMSPEQVAAGRSKVDHRTDIYSLGATLYEMLAFQPAYVGEHRDQVIGQIIHKEPAPPRQWNRRVPIDLQTICLKAMDKDPDRRYQSAQNLAEDLRRYVNGYAIVAKRSGVFTRARKLVRRNRRTILGTLLGLVVLTVVMIVVTTHYRGEREQMRQLLRDLESARNEWIPQGDYDRAYTFLTWAAEQFPDNDEVRALGPQVVSTWSAVTDVGGVKLLLRKHGNYDELAWEDKGQTPLRFTVPKGTYAWKMERDGEFLLDGYAGPGDVELNRSLITNPPVLPGMVRIPAQAVGREKLNPFDIDRCEVTNAQFKIFVESGGYTDQRYWEKMDFVAEGMAISWSEAMARLVDSSGHPGPATWQNGIYLQGKANHPVTGVSWYEAVAYARFVGKVLPTIHHWEAASGSVSAEPMLTASNFSGTGTVAVGELSSVSEYGVYDLAGNAREWCWNATAQGGRRICGGSFREPDKMFLTADSRATMDRSAENGFRCARYLYDEPEGRLGPVATSFRDNRLEQPCSDEVFAGMIMSYAYDPPRLTSLTEVEGRAGELSRHIVVQMHAPHVPKGLPPITAHIFLPNYGKPPFQTVIFFPGLDALLKDTIPCVDDTHLPHFLRSLLRSGRAVVWPVYEGTFERRVEGKFYISLPRAQRTETAVRQYKDLACTVDYLATRTDIDSNRLAFLGHSAGGEFGIRMIALEKRFKAAVLLSGSLTTWAEKDGRPPVVDEINFVPRIHIPVLLFGGEYDVPFPVKESQEPFLHWLGTPPEHVKHHLEPGAGHWIPDETVERETKAWLDKYLGPAT